MTNLAAPLALTRCAPVLASQTAHWKRPAWCRSLADRAPIAMRYMKENLNRAVTSDVETALDAEAANMVLSMGTSDHREAAAAFVEKRTPNFTGE